MNNSVVANDISRLAMLKQLKVYLLKGNGQDKMVIKTDAIQTPQYKSANRIVNAIDHSARVKILTKQEEQALKDYCDSWDDLEGALKDRTTGNKQDLQAFTQTLTGKGGLEKLGYVVAVDLFNGNK